MKCSTKTPRPISSILQSSIEPSVSPARPTPKEFAAPLPLSRKPPRRSRRESLPVLHDIRPFSWQIVGHSKAILGPALGIAVRPHPDKFIRRYLPSWYH